MSNLYTKCFCLTIIINHILVESLLLAFLEVQQGLKGSEVVISLSSGSILKKLLNQIGEPNCLTIVHPLILKQAIIDQELEQAKEIAGWNISSFDVSGGVKYTHHLAYNYYCAKFYIQICDYKNAYYKLKQVVMPFCF